LTQGLARTTRGAQPGRSLIAPTDSIQQPVETRAIDGVDIVFHLAPASEAPAEMHLFFPN
jgi:alkyl sulfatase BDS1-like metallo-beta-lactamase superfamily hydrolase